MPIRDEAKSRAQNQRQVHHVAISQSEAVRSVVHLPVDWRLIFLPISPLMFVAIELTIRFLNPSLPLYAAQRSLGPSDFLSPLLSQNPTSNEPVLRSPTRVAWAAFIHEFHS
ncbi:hypothetical protein P170DRAFT_480167 [Aspergillus steynii IBT 23096]|uniref:Uncharacterized protein n=1 Tax=Aspergillus steynii IBT 23096 TaxID=1392250 RepID=A0A2I2FUU8_9EURO|nr:uncharacterized protein P170DRAFT_480167 [Aspergillus steynii IBT 23096]PLB44402.1 hypothetical protein P170DRAFT_480167 [Aspergillus steynii IBT 23096]